MEPRKYRLLEIATYAYCPMQYHLRFGLQVPWAVVSPEAAFAVVARQSIREYFRCLSTRALRSRAQASMEGVLSAGMDLFAKHFPQAVARRRKFDLILALRDAESIFQPGRDRPIGFDIPTTVGVPSDQPILVEGSLDFAMWRNAGTSLETGVGVSVIYTEDPLEDLVNLEPLRAGFGLTAMRAHAGYDGIVVHETIPLMRPSQKFGSVRVRTQAFASLVRAVDRGIRHRVFFPQSSPTKCDHCPYRPVCSPSLVEADKVDWKPKADNPFVTWPEV